MSTLVLSQDVLLRPIVFTRPLRIVEPTAWVPHIPFAFWIVDALRPRTVVELGTMSGNSYSAFAQAVQALGLEAACYAVDTWQGDPHSAPYGEEVFEEWSAFHDARFSAFSRLVRSTFDDGLGKFDDGSIDLLHIDGFHTYEAVRHDFESWRAKLSPRAVVLFHDVNVRERDFGVWRFWQELARQYPAFSFLHGHGLGVLGAGRELPTDVRALVEQVPRDSHGTFIVRQFFGTLGEALLAQPREAAQKKREAALRVELATATADRDRLAAAAGAAAEIEGARQAAAATEREQLVAAVTQREAELQSVRTELSRLAAEQDRLASAVADAERDAVTLRSRLSEQESRHKSADRAELQSAKAQLASTSALLHDERTRFLAEADRRRATDAEANAWVALLIACRKSRSWALMAPVRHAGALLRTLLRRARFWKPAAAAALPILWFLRPRLARQVLLIKRSRVFDERFYLRQLAATGDASVDLMAAWTDPVVHYLALGAPRGVDPHPLFDTSYYLERNRDVAQAGINPLVHYLKSGGVEGRDPHPLFDSRFYFDRNRDVAEARKNPLLHFLKWGARENRDPNPWFDTSFYVAADPRLQASGMNPLVHYVLMGAAEGRATAPSFDSGFYSRTNPDVADQNMNPLVHFIIAGRQEGRRAVAAPAVSRPGDTQGSADAYLLLSSQVRAAEAARLRDLVVTPPAMITVAERDDLRARAREVVLPAGEPEVSIVIPVLNCVGTTLECLLSIAKFGADVPFEVIVADNGSTDATAAVLPSIPHLRYVRHEENLGFGPACNAGAAQARGQFLVFLNNDVQVQGGWLDALIRPFKDHPDVGASGPKVLFPDGRLQDAGSLVNPDCTSTMLGVFDDPQLPQFNHPRDVDYVSGVCLTIESGVFRSLGGFDQVYAPAYCEDVDLCLRLRQQGRRIVYEPDAVIVHHLSKTSGDLSASFKMAAVTRHQQELSLRHQEQIDRLDRTRVLAFFLPQFHPIPENDVWWGKGFTEWRNVARAKPNFEGHYQPRVAGDLGFYDLRLRETYPAQVALAQRYGVDGFCFYYYWFGGRRLLERPLERLLEDSSVEFPFCLCWANENWTRRWDGLEHEILMAQSHSDEDVGAVMDDMARYLAHPAYIRVDGRPLLLIYRVDRFPDIRKAVRMWRERARALGLGEIFLTMVESFALSHAGEGPQAYGFDAAVEFPPHHGGHGRVEPARLLNQSFKGHVFDYTQTALRYMTKPLPPHRRFRTVMPGWDNTARRQDDGVVFVNSTPGAYQAWLECVLRQTRQHAPGDEQLVFINAWNEWAESAYLEPDLAWGHGYLEATRDARDNVRLGLCAP
jgi:GT2 family glycosyltransferase